MIPVIIADALKENEFFIKLSKRMNETDDKVTAAVTEILSEVRQKKDEALRYYNKKFDNYTSEKFELSKEEIKAAYDSCDSNIKRILFDAARNINDFHQKQKQNSWLDTKPDGSILGQRIRALNRVGIYVPGGTAAYPSSVLMNAIPAKIAGVKELIMITPPPKDGKINEAILAAAYIAGVDRVFLVGGAHGIAALAYGTESIPQVDKIAGPGNIYVATAKKLVYGIVDIDMVAGPSEILIIADESANPKFLAADLMSQAEHDLLASSVLLTSSEKMAEDVVDEIDKQVKDLSRKDIILNALTDYGAIIICKNTKQMCEFANFLAPEHLEVCLNNPLEYIGKLDNAGSIFLGNYSPEPLGDYYAGPNHVLPTNGTSKFFSPLSVDSFIKKSSFIYYNKFSLEQSYKDIITFAEKEGLDAHANSIKVRFE